MMQPTKQFFSGKQYFCVIVTEPDLVVADYQPLRTWPPHREVIPCYYI